MKLRRRTNLFRRPGEGRDPYPQGAVVTQDGHWQSSPNVSLWLWVVSLGASRIVGSRRALRGLWEVLATVGISRPASFD